MSFHNQQTFFIRKDMGRLIESTLFLFISLPPDSCNPHTQLILFLKWKVKWKTSNTTFRWKEKFWRRVQCVVSVVSPQWRAAARAASPAKVGGVACSSSGSLLPVSGLPCAAQPEASCVMSRETISLSRLPPKAAVTLLSTGDLPQIKAFFILGKREIPHCLALIFWSYLGAVVGARVLVKVPVG